jgi:hypothetical protein
MIKNENDLRQVNIDGTGVDLLFSENIKNKKGDE